MKEAEARAREIKAKEKKELERQLKEAKEAEAKAKLEQEKLQKELEAREAKEKAELEEKQKIESEIKAKKELEKQQRGAIEKQKKDAEAEAKAKKELEKQQKEAAEKKAKELAELEKQKKEAEAQKEFERKQKEAAAKKAQEIAELERQKKEAEQSKSNHKAEYHRVSENNSGPTNYDETQQIGGGNTAQQSFGSSEPATTPRTHQYYEPVSSKNTETPSSSGADIIDMSNYIELPLQTAKNIGKSVESPNLIIRDRVDRYNIRITLMIPLYLSDLNEISTSKFDIEQRRKRKYKSFEFIQFYEGMLIGLESLKNEGCNVILNVVDIPGDLPDKVTQAFTDYNIAQSDLIVALLEKNAFEKAAELAQKNNVFILNPFSQRPEILDQNPYVVKLYPSYQGIVASLIEMANKNYSSPNFFIVHSNSKAEKRFLDEFQKQFREQSKSQYTIFDWSANSKLVGMLKNSPGDNIVVNIYDQNKDKNKTQSSLILNRLFSIKKNTPTLVTLPNWTTKYDDVDYSQLQRLNYHFCSNFFLDYNNSKHKSFIDKFKDRFKTEPIGNYAALGNDIMIHFASGINKKGTEKFWQDPNIEKKHSMLYYFHFKRSEPDKGFENQNAYFYHLNSKFQFVPIN